MSIHPAPPAPHTIDHPVDLVTEYFGRAIDALAQWNDALSIEIAELRRTAPLTSDRLDALVEPEAQAIFDALNARTDMTARDFLAAGIALFQSEDYAGAARSFERSLTLNPNSRDAAFNMSQAAYLAADGAEEGSELRTEMWTLLTTAGRALVQLDPKNENAFRLLAQGLIRTGAEQEAVALLEVMQALDFEVIDIQLQPIQGGGAVLRGAVSNRTLTSGSTVRLRISFSSPTGQIIGTQDVAVVVGGAESMTDFEVEFDQEVEVNGYKYEVIGG